MLPGGTTKAQAGFATDPETVLIQMEGESRRAPLPQMRQLKTN
jgi:hypothetical protein